MDQPIDGRRGNHGVLEDRFPLGKRQIRRDQHAPAFVALGQQRDAPDYIRSDNGPEFTARAVREWMGRIGVRTLFIEPGSPWENSYVESFIGKLRDELLNGEIFDTLLEARVVIEDWRREYNQCRPHSALGYRPPAPEALQPRTFTSQVVQ